MVGRKPWLVVLTALAVVSLLAVSVPSAYADEQKPIDLSVTQVDDPDPVLENGLVTYILTVANAGPRPANGVVARVSLTAGSFVSGSGHRWVCTLGALLPGCELKGAIDPGSSADPLRIVVQAPSSSTASEIFHTASVTTEYPEYVDQNTSNNSHTERTKINPGADLAVSQVDEPDPVTAGNTVRYLIAGANNSNAVAATGVALSFTTATGEIVSAEGSGWTCNISSATTASCSLTGGIAPNSSAPMVELQLLTAFSSVDTTTSNKAVISSATGDTNQANNTDTESTTVSSGEDGRATGYIDPAGGQVTTCQVDEPSSTDNTCTTASFPAGPGGIATLIEGPQLDICAQVGCTGGSVDVIVPNGYDMGVTQAIQVFLFVDASISDPADDPTREIYVQKIVEGGEVETFVIPTCSARVPGLPCVRSQERLLNGDFLGTVEMFSGDPIFEVGDGLTAPVG